MTENNYPHKEAIDNLEIITPIITALEQSKDTYIKENLSQHLHIREIKLLKKANSHSKPLHKKARISKYKLFKENPENMNSIFELHINAYIKKYQKLEKKGLVIVNTETEELPYDVTLTTKGLQLIDEIKKLEKQWNDIITEDIEDTEQLLQLLKQLAHKAIPITTNHRKKQKFTL